MTPREEFIAAMQGLRVSHAAAEIDSDDLRKLAVAFVEAMYYDTDDAEEHARHAEDMSAEEIWKTPCPACVTKLLRDCGLETKVKRDPAGYCGKLEAIASGVKGP
jgi:hypothetical protein